MAQSVPLIDMADWSHPDRRRGFISTLGEALERFGFVRVQGHVVNTELVERAYERLSAFFDQPMDEKRKLYLEGMQGQRGTRRFEWSMPRIKRCPIRGVLARRARGSA